MKLLIPFIAIFLISCSDQDKLPPGMSIKVISTGDVFVKLDEGQTIIVGKKTDHKRYVLVGHISNEVHVLQLEGDMSTTRTMELFSTNGVRFTVCNTDVSRKENAPLMLLDQDGDGLVDIKFERKKKFKRTSIEWAEVPYTNNSD